MHATSKPERIGESLLFLTDGQVKKGVEAMFFAYRSFTHDPDQILARYGLGRAHHRALHFIHRNPNTPVNNLLDILGITKQSLNRVLRRLIADGIVVRKTGDTDRRERHLRLTEAGAKLQAELTAVQQARIRQAYRSAGPKAVAGFRQVLEAMMTEETRLYFTSRDHGDTYEA